MSGIWDLFHVSLNDTLKVEHNEIEIGLERIPAGSMYHLHLYRASLVDKNHS